MSSLQDQMKLDLELKGYSPNTQKAYLRCINNFAQHYEKSPEFLEIDDVRAYLYQVINQSKTGASTIDVVYSALKFLYETTLQQEWNIKKLPRTKRGKKLPVLLSPSEITDLFNTASNPKHKALLMTLYGAGLRATEAANLCVSDIDSKNMQIRVRQAKGKKDRYTLLSEENLKVLRNYWLYCKPRTWLFPGSTSDVPITGRTVYQIFLQAKQKASIKKQVSPHTLRHCFATHLLEAGTSIYHIQHLLGHAHPKTTSLYIHLTRKDVLQVKSPLDKLVGLCHD
ncbi:MAG: tyrosine-type recombinase/integrase [Nitrosopumilaceae archaeon]